MGYLCANFGLPRPLSQSVLDLGPMYATDRRQTDVRRASGPKSRTERPRKTKIGREVAHVTGDSDTTFKVKRSKVGALGGCSGGRGNVLAVGNCCYVAVFSAAQGASAPTGEERDGAYRGGRPLTARYHHLYHQQQQLQHQY